MMVDIEISHDVVDIVQQLVDVGGYGHGFW